MNQATKYYFPDNSSCETFSLSSIRILVFRDLDFCVLCSHVLVITFTVKVASYLSQAAPLERPV